MEIELTERETEILDDYLFKKAINLENSGLTDSECYRIFCSIRHKLSKGRKHEQQRFQ